MLYCRYWNIAFFYLQLIRLNVSTAVRVILPPGLQEKSDIVKVVLRKRVYYNHDSNRQSFWIWYTKKKKNKETVRPGCHLTLCKYRICQIWIPKPLQHALPFPCRKLCSIHNVWWSENSFTTQSSLNITPPLKTLLNPSLSTPSMCTCIFNQTGPDVWSLTVFALIIFNICNRRRREVAEGLLYWWISVAQICCCLLAAKVLWRKKKKKCLKVTPTIVEIGVHVWVDNNCNTNISKS